MSIDVDASGGKSIRPTSVYRDTLRTYARRAPQLLLIGAIVFVPLGLLDATVGRIGAIEGANDNGVTIAGVLALVVVQVVLGLLGEVFYSGAVAILIAVRPPDGRFWLRWVAARLAYGRLIAVDVIYDLAVAAGLLLFVAPGVLALTWLALAAPLIELEGCGVREALARSRELVRGRFWRVLAVVGPISLAIQALNDAILSLGHNLLGDTLLSDWLADSAANVILSPFYALPVVLITIQLIGQTRSAAPGQG